MSFVVYVLISDFCSSPFSDQYVNRNFILGQCEQAVVGDMLQSTG